MRSEQIESVCAHLNLALRSASDQRWSAVRTACESILESLGGERDVTPPQLGHNGKMIRELREEFYQLQVWLARISNRVSALEHINDTE